jgi:hypothetical protein
MLNDLLSCEKEAIGRRQERKQPMLLLSIVENLVFRFSYPDENPGDELQNTELQWHSPLQDS